MLGKINNFFLKLTKKIAREEFKRNLSDMEAQHIVYQTYLSIIKTLFIAFMGIFVIKKVIYAWN